MTRTLTARQLKQLKRKAAIKTRGFDILVRPAHVRALVAEVEYYRTLQSKGLMH